MKIRILMTEDEREKIKSYIKNSIDISELIEPYLLKNEDLSGAIILRLNRINEDMRNINFTKCVFGNENSIIDLSGSNLSGSNFKSSKFLGKFIVRNANLQNCNFNYAYVPNVDYCYADLRGISLCEAVLKFGVKCGQGAKFEWKIFENLAKYLQLDIQK